MQFLDVPALSQVRVALRVTAAIAFALAISIGLTGCDNPSAPTAPALAVVAETPEAKLEQVMERLDAALIDAQAAADSGVMSQRKSAYRLISPKEEGGQYTAEVTIQTTLALAKAPAAATLPQPVDEEVDEEEEESDSAEEDEELVPDNGVTRKSIAQSTSVQKDVYLLAYEDDRWKLLTEPKGETEEIIFEIALGK